jgi:hypothetical protein
MNLSRILSASIDNITELPGDLITVYAVTYVRVELDKAAPRWQEIP